MQRRATFPSGGSRYAWRFGFRIPFARPLALEPDHRQASLNIRAHHIHHRPPKRCHLTRLAHHPAYSGAIMPDIRRPIGSNYSAPLTPPLPIVCTLPQRLSLALNR